MKLFERIKTDRKTIQSQPKGERFSYFWEYFKWPAIVAVVLVVALLQFVIGAVTRKEIAFTGYVLNCNIIEKDEDFLRGFYDYAGIDSDKQEAAIYTDLYMFPGQSQKNAEAFQRIIGGIAVEDGDFIAGPAEQFKMCAYNTSRLFIDLRNFLDDETLEKYSGRIYYIDEEILEVLSAPVGETVDTSKIVYPNPLKPETMKKPIPVGISVGDREAFRGCYYFDPDAPVYLGIISNTPHPELMKQFINYIFS